MTKNEMRGKYMMLRDSLSNQDRMSFNEKIVARLLQTEAYRECRLLFVYLSFRSEVDTREIIAKALSDGKRVYLPRVVGKDMEFYEILNLSGLQVNHYGIEEPLEDESMRYIGEAPEEASKQNREKASEAESKSYIGEASEADSKSYIGEASEAESKSYIGEASEVDGKSYIGEASESDGKSSIEEASESENKRYIRNTQGNGFIDNKNPEPEVERYHKLMLLPGLAFDNYGNRIGYGAGFYDRYLAAHTGARFYKIGLAYDLQVADRIDADYYDIKTDCILTSTRLIYPDKTRLA